MPTYKVSLRRIDWYSVTVVTDNEDEALDVAFASAPDICVRCAGHGQEWRIDADEWVSCAESITIQGMVDVEQIQE